MDRSPTSEITLLDRVLRNSASNYLGLLSERGLWFLLTPFLLNQLGTTSYGLWILVGSVVAYGSLLDYGLTSGIVKFVAQQRASSQHRQTRSLLGTALTFTSALGFLIVVTGAVISHRVPALFNVPAEGNSAATLIFLICVKTGLMIPCRLPEAALQGLQRYDLVNLIRVCGSVLLAAASVTILLAGGGVSSLIAASIVVLVLTQTVSAVVLRRIAPELAFGSFRLHWQVLRPVLSFCTPLFVMNVAGRLQTKTDELVIAGFLTLSAVTPYAISRTLAESITVVTDQFMRVLLPVAAQLRGENAQDQMRFLYIASTRLTLAICVCIACPVIIMREPILALWVGEAYVEYAYVVLILAIACLIDTSQWPAGSILQGMSRHKPLAMMSVYAAITNVGLSILMVRPFGLTGIALGTLIPTAIFCLGVVLPYAIRVIGIGKAQLVHEIALPALVPAVPMSFSVFLCRHFIDQTSFGAVLISAITGMLTYIAVYLFWGASRAERETCRRFANIALRFLEAR